MLRIFSSIGLLLCVLFPGVSAQEDHLASLEQTALRRAAEAVAPCVVQIETVGGLEMVDRLLVGSGPTTGLIVAEDGYIVSSAIQLHPAAVIDSGNVA